MWPRARAPLIFKMDVFRMRPRARAEVVKDVTKLIEFEAHRMVVGRTTWLYCACINLRGTEI